VISQLHWTVTITGWRDITLWICC